MFTEKFDFIREFYKRKSLEPAACTSTLGWLLVQVKYVHIKKLNKKTRSTMTTGMAAVR